jgi:hypothetical protein
MLLGHRGRVRTKRKRGANGVVGLPDREMAKPVRRHHQCSSGFEMNIFWG